MAVFLCLVPLAAGSNQVIDQRFHLRAFGGRHFVDDLHNLLAKVVMVGSVWAVGAGLAWGVGWLDGVHGCFSLFVKAAAAGVAVDKCLSRGAVGESLFIEFKKKAALTPAFGGGVGDFFFSCWGGFCLASS